MNDDRVCSICGESKRILNSEYILHATDMVEPVEIYHKWKFCNDCHISIMKAIAKIYKKKTGKTAEFKECYLYND